MAHSIRPSERSFQQEMDSEQREQLLHVAEISLQWVAGKITIEDLKNKLGKIKYSAASGGVVSFIYNGDDIFAVSFHLYEKWDMENHGLARDVSFGIASWVTTNISRDMLERRLGLRKRVQGELIDGVRKERGDYFNPVLTPDYEVTPIVALGYRLPLPDNSLFDVYVRAEYKKVPDQPGRSTFENTDNLRVLEFVRSYLTSEELQQRNQARH